MLYSSLLSKLEQKICTGIWRKTGPPGLRSEILGPVRTGPNLYNFLYPIKMSQIFVLVCLKLIRTNS